MIEGRGDARPPNAPSLRLNVAGNTSPYTSNLDQEQSAQSSFIANHEGLDSYKGVE